MGEDKIIYEGDAAGSTTVAMTGNHIILSYFDENKSGQNESITATINLDDNSFKKIISSEFTRNMPNYSGTFIIYASGWDGGFCYEEVKMSNESIEEDDSGKSSIYYYSFKDGKTEKLINFPHKVNYIRGDNECFITSDYSLTSKENSGKITIKENGTYNSYDIPGVIPAFDIMDSYKLSDKDIIVYNQECFWIYNLDNKTYYKEKYKYLNNTAEDYATLVIKAYGSQFAYLEPNKSKIIVHTFTLETGAN